jgi:transcriptional regulator with GAF, ATPase, and Fis domain
MSVDENVFFREATLRICNSLNVAMALKSCFDYIKLYIPMNRMGLHIHDEDLNLIRPVATVGEGGMAQLPGQVLRLPEKGRSEREAMLKADLLKNEVVIRIINQPDQMEGIPEILERIGLNAKTSLMVHLLKLEGNRIGSLVVFADGLNRYTDEHARLLKLLHDPFAIAVSNALEHREVIRLKDMLADDNRYLYQELRSVSGSEIIGTDFGLKAVMKMIEQVAPLDSPVLLLGETGAGKEVIANAIHYTSPRRNGPFVKVNCGAIPENLIDSELFGHEKGAFTGAVAQKRGRFERADKGTIFLDEVGEFPPQVQVRLLRVLQEKRIERVGGTTSIPVDIRIISATNRNLQEMVASGRFREDLWFRLNVFPVMIPPLRQRKEDIPALVHHFIECKCAELKLVSRPVLARGAMDRLVAYDWPGNVRELQNMIERALIMQRDGILSFDMLLPPAGAKEAVPPAESTGKELPSFEDMAKRHIQQALQRAGGKISGPRGAAELLRINPSTLRTRMNRLAIPYGRKSWQPVRG